MGAFGATGMDLGSTTISSGSSGGKSQNSGWSMGGTMGSAQTAMQFNKDMMEAQQAFNAAEAQKNRDWQEMMANTAYQRAVKDMKAAGINPILAATNGGAAVGSGAQASSAMATGMTDSYYSSENQGTSSQWGFNSSYSYDNMAKFLGESIQNMKDAFEAMGNGISSSFSAVTNFLKGEEKSHEELAAERYRDHMTQAAEHYGWPKANTGNNKTYGKLK